MVLAANVEFVGMNDMLFLQTLVFSENWVELCV